MVRHAFVVKCKIEYRVQPVLPQQRGRHVAPCSTSSSRGGMWQGQSRSVEAARRQQQLLLGFCNYEQWMHSIKNWSFHFAKVAATFECPKTLHSPKPKRKHLLFCPLRQAQQESEQDRERKREGERRRRAAEKTKDCWQLLLLLIRFGGDRKGMRTKFRTIKRLVASCQLRQVVASCGQTVAITATKQSRLLLLLLLHVGGPATVAVATP